MLTSSWPLMTSALTWSMLTKSTVNGSTARSAGSAVSGSHRSVSQETLKGGARVSGPVKGKEKGKGERLNGLKGKAGRLQKPNYSARLGPDGSLATWAAGLVAPQAGSARRAGFIFGLGRRTGRGALAAHSSFSSFFFSFPSFLSPMDRRTGPKGGGSVASGKVEPWWSSPGQSKAGSRRQVRPRWRQGKAEQGCGSVGVRAK